MQIFSINHNKLYIEFSIDVQMQYLTKFIGLANKCFHLDFYFCLTS